MFSSQGLKGKVDNFVHQRLFTGLSECYCKCGEKKKTSLKPFVAPEGAP